MSGHPSPFKSPKSTPMPLNESWPSTFDFGVVNDRRPSNNSKREMTGRREVVQQAVGTEVVGEVDFGEQVAVEIGCADCE